MANYSVVIDSIVPYIVETDSDQAYTFSAACQEIIDYATEGRYLIQQKRWEQILDSGEEAYLAA